MYRIVFLISVSFLWFSCPKSEAQDWSRFRGPSGSGVGAGAIPVSWSDTENLEWKTKLIGKGSSSPVIHGDRIFLTAHSGYAMSAEKPGDRANLKLHVLCLSLLDGKLLWNKQVDPAPEEQQASKRVMDHGYASPTPCVDDKNVYASFGPSGVIAFSHEGERLWRKSVGTNTAGFGAAASPIVCEDLVIMNASIEDGAVYGLEKSTGKTRWKTDGIVRSWTTPTLVKLEDGSSEMILNQKGAILGLDPTTGKQRWTCYAIQDYVVPCVVADGQTLYCSGGRSNMTFVVKAGGSGDVSDSNLVWDMPLGANVTSPLLHNGYLYWSHDKSIALCLRASDGEMMFRERLPTRSRVYASIVSDGEKLFLTTRDAGILVLDASPEYKELAVNKLGGDDESFNATPAIVGDRLLIRSDTTLYCVKQK
ncbi:MAG: PQQ-binding-like beta-propeller repeat protein [Planctomycetota bacterium]